MQPWLQLAANFPLFSLTSTRAHKPNVLLLHFSEMKKDHEGSVHKIAQHLGFEPTAEQWPKILEYTSFKWMKVATLCVGV